MGLKEWIIPQDRVFYDLLEQQAQLAVEAVDAFRHLLSHFQQQEVEREKVAQIEHRADRLSHDIFERLNRTFITPIDREDRSEEHTAELQSQSNLVCRLLLDKKNQHTAA